MKTKVQERMDQLLRNQQNRRLLSDALAKGAESVVLKDDQDRSVTVHLQRSREVSLAR